MLDVVAWLATTIQRVSDSVLIQSFLVACIGFIFTVVGASLALVGLRAGDVITVYGMGFAAGIMLSASFISLLIPATEIGGIIPTATGFLIGALAVHFINLVLPHEHFVKGFEGSEKLRRRLKAAWLLAFAMIIHNIPEGAAVGAAVVESLVSGVVLALAISMQNMPEGLAMALPFISTKKSLKIAMGVTALSGAIEPIAAVGATALITVFRGLLPYMLSFAAGAMVYVVSHEIIPETHSEKREIRATVGLLLGLILMLVLDAYYD